MVVNSLERLKKFLFLELPVILQIHYSISIFKSKALPHILNLKYVEDGAFFFAKPQGAHMKKCKEEIGIPQKNF